jgi:hypothetical protein
MPGRTAKYYASNPEARKKRLEYQKEYNKQDREVKKRVELNAENRKRGTYGNGDGLDVAHTKSGTRLQKASVNRGSRTAMPGDKRARGNGGKK